jgi:hypothetical protein
MIVVLDAGGGPLFSSAQWAAWSGEEVVLLTAHAGDAASLAHSSGFKHVRYFGDSYPTAKVEFEVLRLAEGNDIKALIALQDDDAIRAGALREHLALPGQRRDDAIAWRDLIDMRTRLRQAGVPCAKGAGVQQVSDLHLFGHCWGYPLRVRERRMIGWPVAAELRDDADVSRFAERSLPLSLEVAPSLVAEAEGTRRTLTVRWRAGQPAGDYLEELADRSVRALRSPDDVAWSVVMSRIGRHDAWVVDSARPEPPQTPGLLLALGGVSQTSWEEVA